MAPSIETRDSDDFRLVSHAPPPEWVAKQVMYQVMPDRFARSAAVDARPVPAWAQPAQWGDAPIGSGPATSRQFFGGDLDGIAEHLDQLERLGATLLYLTPFFPGASNHRYDAHSFDAVDPVLGGDAALERLVGAAHERGIRVIGDLTTNHTGDGHEWFRAAHRTPDAPEGAFYYWRDPRHEQYESWLGVPSLPKLDWRSPELRRRFIEGEDSVVARWLRPPYSLDGWRIDVANMTGRFGDHDVNGEVRRTLRRTMEQVNPDTVPIGEITHDTARFAGYALAGAVPVAVGLSVALPGIPVVFAGDELGQTGVNGEYSRTTMPWPSIDEHRASIEQHAALIALRRQKPALSSGGLRWLHAEADAVVFIRETPGQSVLLCAARADVRIELPTSAFSGHAHRLVGNARLEGHRVTSQGMSFTAWSLPGVHVPEFGNPRVPSA